MDNTSRFDTNWSPSDRAGLLPSNIHTRHIPRAWERKPYSPFSRKGSGSKVWRRVQMPSLSGLSHSTTPKPSECAEHHRGGTIQSPKKITKRICLNNGLGQDWKVADWDRGRGGHPRKSAPRPPIVLRSGAIIDPNLEDEDETKVVDAEEEPALENEPEVDNDNNPEDEWSDVSSEDEQQVHFAEESTHEQEPEQDNHILTSEEEVVGSQERSEIQLSPIKVDADLTDSPLSREKPTFMATFARPSETAFVPSPVKRSASAPVEEVALRDARPKPRISDDTAILRAFLNRAAATKKPMAKRESISNRRDSDTVRQALASPTKNDVLMELDPNSPSPRKESPPNDLGAEKVAPSSPSAGKSASISIEDDKPARRSGRSRVRPALLLNQMISEQPVRGPNKITIRGPSDQLPLKRSEVQELSAVTRSNTRKNQGQAVMPLERLPELAAELAGEGDQIIDKEIPPNSKGRSVWWDQTLAYFQESPTEPMELEVEKVEAPILAGDLPLDQNAITTEEAPLSPTKTRSRRARPTPPAEQPTETSSESVNASKPKATSTPVPKRKSRIATPAKALLSSSLLPADVPSQASQPKIETQTKKTRSLPAPKKLNFNAATSKDSVAPAQPTLQQSTPKKAPSATSFSGIPGIKPMTRIEPPSLSNSGSSSANPASALKKSSATGRDDAPVPGLASPAKKRRAVRNIPAAAKSGEEVLPGLSSPAKKRGRTLF